MEWLRWILLAVGAFLIASIYVSGRRRQPRPPEDLRTAAQAAADTPDQPPSDAPPPAAYADPVEPSWTGAPEPAHAPADEALRAAGDWAPTDLDLPASRTPAGDAFEPAQSAEPAAQEAPVAPAAPVPEGGTGEPDAPVADAEPEAEPLAAGAEGPYASTAVPAEPEPEPPTEPERVVVLYLVAREGERLVGAKLAAAFARHGLEHGELGAFHARARVKPDADGPRPTDFSVANAVEPGAFDPATMDTLSTPGIALILRVPGPPSPVTAFDRMLSTAHALAEELDARVLDQARAPLTRQAEQHLRDELRFATAGRATERGRP